LNLTRIVSDRLQRMTEQYVSEQAAGSFAARTGSPRG
jgi:hypothetical protein